MGSLMRRVLVYTPLSQKKQLAAVLDRSDVEGVPVQCIDEAEATRRRPDLVIWVAQPSPDAGAVAREALALDQRWHPAPLLLVLHGPIQPGELPLGELPIAGILQNPDASTLCQSLPVLMGGGRVFDVQSRPGAPVGEHQGLNEVFSQGLTQIQTRAKLVAAQLQQRPKTLMRWVLEGQQRELAMARTLVLTLHGATATTLGLKGLTISDTGGKQPVPMSTGLTLRSRTATGLWDTLSQRLLGRIAGNPQPLEQQLLALGALAARNPAQACCGSCWATWAWPCSRCAGRGCEVRRCWSAGGIFRKKSCSVACRSWAEPICASPGTVCWSP